MVAKDDDGGIDVTNICIHGLFGQIVLIVPPNEFTLISPEQDAQTGLMPTFNWNASSDADLYDEIAYTLSYGTDPSDLKI